VKSKGPIQQDLCLGWCGEYVVVVVVVVHPDARGESSLGLVQHAFSLAPPMIQHLANGNSAINIAIQHCPHKIDTRLAHDIRHSQIVVHDFVNAVERVLVVDDCVEQDAQRPDILLLPAVALAGEDFRSCVIWIQVSDIVLTYGFYSRAYQ
jgi:hypothetical protein